MPKDPAKVQIYHITPIANLTAIVANGKLLSDAALASTEHDVIGYSHIKERRLSEYRIPCCGNRFVGEFVPFYYCPRSPMLLIINNGKTGKPIGYQREIVHLVSTVSAGIATGHQWAISDGNAGAAYAQFKSTIAMLDEIDWGIINSNSWGGDRLHRKAAEFLVADSFPWASITEVGCIDEATRSRVQQVLTQAGPHVPNVTVRRNWYY